MEPGLLIATAGHVDHGKSSLVRMMTGMDPDRLAEEKARGMSIALGYAHSLRARRQYAFIDVPGHERFVPTMLAGVGALDAALLIVAADDGIMPQTKEHAQALAFLAVPNLALVITKIDLVDTALLELVHEELTPFLSGFGWGKVPRFEVSNQQPSRIAALWNWLGGLEKPPARRGGVRFSVDRVFSLPSAGTLATGTLLSGKLRRGTRLLRWPDGESFRLRELQRHGVAVEEVTACDRASLKLAGLARDSLERGYQFFEGSLPVSSRRIWVRLEVFNKDWTASPKHDLHFYHYSAQRIGRMAWMKDGWAQLEVLEPLPIRVGDRLLLRDGTPLRLCAGALVVDPQAPALRKSEAQASLSAAPVAIELKSWLLWWLERQKTAIAPQRLAALWGFDPLSALEASESESPPEAHWPWVRLADGAILTRALWEKALRQCQGALRQAHKQRPHWPQLPLRFLRDALPKELRELDWLDQLLKDGAQQGWLQHQADWVRASGHRPSWSKAQLDASQELKRRIDPHGFLALSAEWANHPKERAFGEILALWHYQEQILLLAEQLYLESSAFVRHRDAIFGQFQGRTFSVIEVKELLGLSRKYIVPLLEYLDRIGETKRLGDQRVWLRQAPAQPRVSNGDPTRFASF